jgi:CheY-like chemotaxis protein
MKILVCDDEQDILQIVKLALSKEYDVVARDKIVDIEDLVAEVKPDVILLDVWIPEMGGEEAVKRLKANPKTAEIPVYLLSGNQDIAVIASRTGANGFLPKPFKLSELKELVNQSV